MLVDGPDIVATGSGPGPDAATSIDVRRHVARARLHRPARARRRRARLRGRRRGDPRGPRDASRPRHHPLGDQPRGRAARLAARRASPTIADLAGDDPLVLGSHLEGPFLAAEQRGAHNARVPARAAARRGRATYRGRPRHPAAAHHRAGAARRSRGRRRARRGRRARSPSGTRPPTRRARGQAFDRGARLLTHAFNAMPGIHHRAPGPVVAAFDDERVTLELILDGKHVHPSVVHARVHGGARQDRPRDRCDGRRRVERRRLHPRQPRR